MKIIDPDVEAEMNGKATGLRKSRLLVWPEPYEASIMNYVNDKDGTHVLYSGGFGMGYYWEIRLRGGEYMWVDLDSCGGYEVESYVSASWSEMAGYARRIVGKYVIRQQARLSRKGTVSEK